MKRLTEEEKAVKFERLPAWAKAEIESLRRKVQDAERGEAKARLATSPFESNAILDPYDTNPIGLGDGQVRFLLDRVGYNHGDYPARERYVDIRVDAFDRLSLHGGAGLVIQPYASNACHVKVSREP